MAQSASGSQGLVQLLSITSTPVYALDESRYVVYANPSLLDWAGVTAQQLIGQRCDYHSGTAAVASLCPPPDAFAGNHVRAIVGCRREGGELARRWGEFIPLGWHAVECPGVLGVLEAADLTDADLDDASESRSEPAALHERIRLLRQALRGRYGVERLVGDSPAAARVRDQVALAGATHFGVLITGPPGSGREHVARTIHYGADLDQSASLAPLDCRLLDGDFVNTTIDSIHNSPEWKVDHPVTLLLLDVDRLVPEAQTTLWNQIRAAVTPMRILATAREPLLEQAGPYEFRKDLANRLSTLVIRLPALKSRREDIPMLAQSLLEEINSTGGRQLGGFTPDALDKLALHDWPRNVDELYEMVLEAHQCAEGPWIQAADLPVRIRLAENAAVHPPRHVESIVLEDFLKEVESEMIRRALGKSKGNKTKAAELLGMNRARLHRRLAHLGLE